MSEITLERIAWIRHNKPQTTFSEAYLRLLRAHGFIAILDYFGERHDISGLLEGELPCHIEQPTRLVANEMFVQ